jgi:hypothetical protein
MAHHVSENNRQKRPWMSSRFEANKINLVFWPAQNAGMRENNAKNGAIFDINFLIRF